LERHDSIASAAKLIRSALVHHQGQPMSQHTKAGFNRRRSEVSTSVFDNSPPSEDFTRTRREDIALDVGSRLFDCCIAAICSGVLPFLASNPCGVGQFAASAGNAPPV